MRKMRIALCYSIIFENYADALIEAGKALGISVQPVWFYSRMRSEDPGDKAQERTADSAAEEMSEEMPEGMLPFSEFNVSDFDGLLLPGGGDFDPSFYGEEMQGSINPDIRTDCCQFAMADAFIKEKKPILGICRGHQLINIYFGGSLYQDIPEKKSHMRLNPETDNRHILNAEPGSILHELYGETFAVNSSHHQAVKKIGRNLHVTARCRDGVIEAMEHENLPILTVQFHPERMDYRNRREDTVAGGLIFEYFLRKIAKS